MQKIEPSKKQIQSLITSISGPGVRDLASIGQGEWSSAYSYRMGEDEYIIRFSALDEDFRKDQYACRFASPNLPIPKITQIGEAFGGYYAISKKAPGTAIDFLDSTRMQQVAPAVIALLDALRLVDVSNTQGYGGWDVHGNGHAKSWKESLLHITEDHPGIRIHGWRSKLAASIIGTAAFDQLAGRFASLLNDCPEERHLIHADLLHYNLLIDDDDNQVSAVIDWGCSRYGDFLYELAWFTFWSPWFSAMEGIDFRQLALQHYAEIGLDVPNFDERMKAYELHIGLDSITYCSFTENWDIVEKVTSQSMRVIQA
jgi:hygromycin-B 4-O-kinase